jgi:CheY-like chemotaxis protein
MVQVGDRPRDTAPQLLIVDDNRDAADTLALLLGLWGYHPRVAYDGPSALDQIRFERPDGVLLDLGLPGVDGYQLATDLRRQPDWTSTPLIAVTGYATPAHRDRARAAGFDHFLVKPVDPVGLQKLLGEMLRVRLLATRMDSLARRHAALAGEAAALLDAAREHAAVLRRTLAAEGDAPLAG